MRYHSIAFLAGFLLDLCLGDPHWLYHPIRLIGAWIAWLEKKLHKVETPRNEKRERVQGTYLVLAVLLMTGLCVAGILTLAYLLHPVVGVIVESVMTYQILATKCLKVESMRGIYLSEKKGFAGGKTGGFHDRRT